MLGSHHAWKFLQIILVGFLKLPTWQRPLHVGPDFLVWLINLHRLPGPDISLSSMDFLAEQADMLHLESVWSSEILSPMPHASLSGLKFWGRLEGQGPRDAHCGSRLVGVVESLHYVLDTRTTPPGWGKLLPLLRGINGRLRPRTRQPHPWWQRRCNRVAYSRFLVMFCWLLCCWSYFYHG